jgi:hypothetical protein
VDKAKKHHDTGTLDVAIIAKAAFLFRSTALRFNFVAFGGRAPEQLVAPHAWHVYDSMPT